jgi:hypothetical protein
MLQEPVTQMKSGISGYTLCIVQRNKVYSNEFTTQVKRFLCGAPKSLLTRFSNAQQRACWWFLESISHRENGSQQPAFWVHGKLGNPRSFSG